MGLDVITGKLSGCFAGLNGPGLWLLLGGAVAVCLIGCQEPKDYRKEADRVAEAVISAKQEEAFGTVEPFSIERPSDILRRRLLEGQDLPTTGAASLGTDQLPLIDHWPEPNYPYGGAAGNAQALAGADDVVRLSLLDALQVGARNSMDYQSRKESVFQAALGLDLERHEFRDQFIAQVESLASTDGSDSRTESGTEYSGSVDWTRQLKSGAELSAAFAIDLANLLTMGGASSMGLVADGSVSIPLMRGSGRHIVTEPLLQSERDVIYAMYEFERYKRTFAVEVAQDFLSVLQQMDEVDNARENYRSLIASARRSRRLADAGRLPEIQVDQAIQNELRARDRWISATESYKSRLDSFKTLLGLPPDARVELNRDDLELIRASGEAVMERQEQAAAGAPARGTPTADARIELKPPGYENAGVYEIDELDAIRLGLDHRLDLKVQLGEVYDAQRNVVVQADALGAELTLLGSAELGEHRSVSSATSDDARLRGNEGYYAALLNLDLPLERTAERNDYRNSYIELEQAVRDLQSLEDSIKLSVRNRLRDLLESRESLSIQAQSVVVAQRRVRSINLFLEAGRAEIRDLLEAQEALLSAQNGLTSAAISYRVAELQLQRDMGVLQVDNGGLWTEFTPEGIDHVN